MTALKSPSDPQGRTSLGRVRTAGLIAAALAALLLHLFAGDRLSDAVFDGWQRLRPRPLAQSSVQVVEIDADSVREVGQWPWPRYHLARLAERIAERGAIAIGFDMTFPQKDPIRPENFAELYPELSTRTKAEVLVLPSMDDVFAGVIGRHPVVLGRAGTTEDSVDYSEPVYDDLHNLPVEAVFSRPLPDSVTDYPNAVSSIPILDEVAAGHGLINGLPDRDGVVRRIPVVGRIAGVPNTGFALELARVARGVDRIEPVVKGARLSAVRFGDRIIPVDPDGRMRLRYGEMSPRSVTSAVQVLRKDFPANAFAGKVVIINDSSAGSADVVATPLEAQTSGVRVQAQAVDAILNGAWLARPAWAPAAEWIMAALLALATIPVFRRLRRFWSVAGPLALALFIVAASWVAFARYGLLLDPATPLIVGAAAGGAVLVGLFVEGGKVQRRLRAALVEEQVSAARAQGELEAARDIQLGMLPPRATLSQLAGAADLDALLEPARTVGGDFYDAFEAAPGRICFLIGDVTGKGVPAALFMALSKALSRSVLLREQDDLGAAVAALNTELARDNSQDMFVTMLVGLFDVVNGGLALVNAGHENPVILRADGRVEELAMEGGPPLAVIDDYPYATEPITLAPGDGIVIVTDGVTEAQDGQGHFFERARVVEILRTLSARWCAADATGALLYAVRMFEDGHEPTDDLTVMALRHVSPISE